MHMPNEGSAERKGVRVERGNCGGMKAVRAAGFLSTFLSFSPSLVFL